MNGIAKYVLILFSPIAGYVLGYACASDRSSAVLACCFVLVRCSLLLANASVVRLVGFSFGLMYYGCGTAVMVTATNGDFSYFWIASVIGLAFFHGSVMALLSGIYRKGNTHLGLLMAVGWPIFELSRFFLTKLFDTHGLRLVDLGLTVSNDLLLGQLVKLCGVPLLSSGIAAISGCVVQACLPGSTAKERTRDLTFSALLLIVALTYGRLARADSAGNSGYATALLVQHVITESTINQLKSRMESMNAKQTTVRNSELCERKIVFFPEIAMRWQVDGDASGGDEQSQNALLSLSAENELLLFIGAEVHWKSKWCNACVVVDEGKLTAILPKRHLVPCFESRFPMLEGIFLSQNRVPLQLPSDLPSETVEHDMSKSSMQWPEYDPIALSSICYDLFFQETYGEISRGCKMSFCLFGKSLDPSGTLDALAAKHARLRAIETKRPFVFVADGGPCMVYSELGDRLPVVYEDFLVKSFKVPTRISDGSVSSSYFTIPMICMAVAFAWLVVTHISPIWLGMTA